MFKVSGVVAAAKATTATIGMVKQPVINRYNKPIHQVEQSEQSIGFNVYSSLDTLPFVRTLEISRFKALTAPLISIMNTTTHCIKKIAKIVFILLPPNRQLPCRSQPNTLSQV